MIDERIVRTRQPKFEMGTYVQVVSSAEIFQVNHIKMIDGGYKYGLEVQLPIGRVTEWRLEESLQPVNQRSTNASPTHKGEIYEHKENGKEGI